MLAPREMNVTLGNPSPDKKWFLDEIGDGPMPMTIFGKPFDELGGVFIDYKANRLRSVTLRNTIGIQIISAADGSRKTIATPPNTRVTNARWTPDGTGVIYMTLGDDCDAHLGHRPRDEQAAPDHEDVAADDVRHELRLRSTTASRSSPCFRPTAARARPLPPPVPGRSGSARLDGRRQEPPAHVPEPDDDAVRLRSCSNGTRPVRSASSTSRRAR